MNLMRFWPCFVECTEKWKDKTLVVENSEEINKYINSHSIGPVEKMEKWKKP